MILATTCRALFAPVVSASSLRLGLLLISVGIILPTCSGWC